MAAMTVDDPELAWFLYRQGLFFREQGEHDKAIPFYEEARAVTERVFGSEHPQVAMSLHDLADAYTDKGNFAEAEALYSRALAIRRKRLGERHPEVGQTLTRLGELCARTGRDDLAEGHLGEAIGIFAATQAFPEDEAEACVPFVTPILKETGDGPGKVGKGTIQIWKSLTRSRRAGLGRQGEATRCGRPFSALSCSTPGGYLSFRSCTCSTSMLSTSPPRFPAV